MRADSCPRPLECRLSSSHHVLGSSHRLEHYLRILFYWARSEALNASSGHLCASLVLVCHPMAAKAQLLPQDNTGSTLLSQAPPSISPTSSVLASIITLPEHPLIVYSAFECPPATQNVLEQMELARRKILFRNEGKSLLDSLFPCVHVTKDSSVLYVFAIGSTARICDVQNIHATLQLETLICECIYPTFPCTPFVKRRPAVCWLSSWRPG